MILTVNNSQGVNRTGLQKEKFTIGSYSIPWDQPSLLTFLLQNLGAPRFYWNSDKHPLSFAGFGILTHLTASGADRFHQIQEGFESLAAGWESFGEAPEMVGRLRFFGGFSFYDEVLKGGIWSSFPAANFVLPRYVLSLIDGESWLTVNGFFHKDVPREEKYLALKEMVWNIPGLSNIEKTRRKNSQPRNIKDALAYDQWKEAILTAKKLIRIGDLDKVVLSRSKSADIDMEFSLLPLMANLRSHYPDCYSFLFETPNGDAFFGASPELLVSVEDGVVQTVALAGSLKRGQTFEEDIRLGHQLLKDKKDNQEHNYVIQAIRENLSPFVSQIKIPQSPGLMLLNNVQHLMTPIEGNLSDNWSVFTLTAALHPTPAVGGLPKNKALALIKKFEPHDRGWYAAPIGWFDDRGNGLFAVSLRSAVLSGQKINLFAGAGIVKNSDPEKEWNETEWKFRPVLDAIGGEIIE